MRWKGLFRSNFKLKVFTVEGCNMMDIQDIDLEAHMVVEAAYNGKVAGTEDDGAIDHQAEE